VAELGTRMSSEEFTNWLALDRVRAKESIANALSAESDDDEVSRG
jgi:hypothetical protein